MSQGLNWTAKLRAELSASTDRYNNLVGSDHPLAKVMREQALHSIVDCHRRLARVEGPERDAVASAALSATIPTRIAIVPRVNQSVPYSAQA